MEQDSALPEGTVVDASRRKVRDAAGYIAVIGHSYGQVPDTDSQPGSPVADRARVPEARRLGRPILVFLMGERAPGQEGRCRAGPGEDPQASRFPGRGEMCRATSPVHRVY